MNALVRRGLWFMLAAAGGCSAIGRKAFTAPIVSFRDVQLRSVSLTHGTLVFLLDVYNPNRYELKATKLSYTVVSGPLTVGEGKTDTTVAVPGHATGLVKLPVRVQWAGLGVVGRKVAAGDSVDYRVSGEMTVATPVGDFTRPFTRAGRMATTR
jgi:LEA14-like dessication related protein